MFNGQTDSVWGIAVVLKDSELSTRVAAASGAQVLGLEVRQSLCLLGVGINGGRSERDVTLKISTAFSQRLAAVVFLPQKIATAPFFTSLRPRSIATPCPSCLSRNRRGLRSLPRS
jgi:hypothetical protein